MWDIRYTTQYKKDLKKFANDSARLRKVYQIVKILQKTGTVPAKLKPHRLKGNYEGCMECHIESDFLLVWINRDEKLIYLMRLGSHSELFGK